MSPAFLLLTALLFASPRAQGSWGVAYPPADPSTSKPAIVFLHGMWASPEDSCPSFEKAAVPFGFLVCPRGNAPLGQGKMWAGSYGDAARSIRAALDAAAALAPGKLDRAGGTLLGFSNGAYFAAEVALREPGRWTGLILMSMKLELDGAALQGAGVHRILLAAGDQDESRPSMQSLASRLSGSGMQTRFMSMGPVGHAFPSDMGERMCDALSWVRESTAQVCTGN